MKTVFIGDFSSRDDVLREFDIPASRLEGADLLVAAYRPGDYSGSAEVLLDRGGSLYLVSASHCSCNGLEGSWQEDCVTAKSILNMSWVRDGFDHGDEVTTALHNAAVLCLTS